MQPDKTYYQNASQIEHVTGLLTDGVFISGYDYDGYSVSGFYSGRLTPNTG